MGPMARVSCWARPKGHTETDTSPVGSEAGGAAREMPLQAQGADNMTFFPIDEDFGL